MVPNAPRLTMNNTMSYSKNDLKFEKDADGKVANIYFKNDDGEHRAKKL